MQRLVLSCFLVYFSTTQLAGAVLWNVRVGGKRTVGVVFDFVDLFETRLATNASAAHAGNQENSGGVELPGIFLHPQGDEDAVVRYERISIPQGAPFLVFRIGFRDGVPWDGDRRGANGVCFKVVVDGEEAFTESREGTGWQGRAVDMTPWSGKTVSVELRTNAIDGNSSYDWAVFGQPLLVVMPEGVVLGVSPPEEGDTGLALVKVQCSQESTFSLTLGGVSQAQTLPPGPHWIPIWFDSPGTPAIDVATGAATVKSHMLAAFDSFLTWPTLELASPRVTAGQPFNVLFTVMNEGLGRHTQAEEIQPRVLSASTKEPVEVAGIAPQNIGRLAPKESQTLVWEGLVIAEPGDFFLRAGPEAVRLHVFPPEPELETGGMRERACVVTDGALEIGYLEHGWCRVALVSDGTDTYGLAEVWNGAEWQRVGSVYPLADLRVQKTADSGHLYSQSLVLTDIRMTAPESGGLVLDASAHDGENMAGAVNITFVPDAGASRIAVHAAFTAKGDIPVLAFYAPALLAGDGAFGVKKDFAIFPGLEYLEGDEASSSTRDLAYPLSDRRVPAVHTITAPVMAVQAQNALVGLIWDIDQEWAPGQQHPAARFLAPSFDSKQKHIQMSLFAPSIGQFVRENTYQAHQPYLLKTGETLRLDMNLVLDHAARYPSESIVHGPHRGGLVLQAMQHFFDVFGMPGPSPQPRTWDEERALCRHAYAESLWSEDPPGWRHCAGWTPGLFTGHAVPQLMDIRAGLESVSRSDVERRIGFVLSHALQANGPGSLWNSAGCHIACGELPFIYGFVPESMKALRDHALSQLGARENGLWVWRTGDEKLARLGDAGGHTLGQASQPAWFTLRAARLTGDQELTRQALDAMKQMELYEVPRGAQMWECPMYQPDILASARAVRAYCEAYRLTGDLAHLAHARYWAWTGLPFLYLWELDGYPTMRYNVIAVIGSTFYTHSWIGLPVVWCGLVYAYALQDLAEFDDSFPWKTVAQGITNSAMWQQYSEGPHAGCYPDSWNMVKNAPNPADISPENILMNEFRLRGDPSPHIRFARVAGPNGPIVLNSAGDTAKTSRSARGDTLTVTLTSPAGFPVFTMLAPVDEPSQVGGTGERAPDSEALQSVPTGWLFDGELRAVILKHTPVSARTDVTIVW